MTRSRLTRYLHWGTAALFVPLALSGLATSDDLVPGAGAPASLAAHMVMGGLMAGLVAWRLARMAAGRPGPSATRLAGVGHWAIMILLAVMAFSGIGMAVLAGLPASAFGSAPLPDLSELSPALVHGAVALPVIALVSGHAALGLWHGIVRRDGVLSAMAGRAAVSPPPR